MTTSAHIIAVPLTRKPLGVAILAGYLLLYGGALFAMHATSGFEISEHALYLYVECVKPQCPYRKTGGEG